MVALTVEGYQSSGSANVYSHTLNIGGSSGGGQTPVPTPPPGNGGVVLPQEWNVRT